MNIWRAKYYKFNISQNRKVLITIRRFKTAKINRSKKFSQIVIPFEIGKIKEFSFRLHQTKRRSRKQKELTTLQRFTPTPASVLITLGLIGTIVFGIQISSSHALEPTKTFSTTKQVAPVKSLPASVPTNISIPSVNIDYPIITVGLDTAGAIQLPPVLSWNTGWYNGSPTPGQIGPSIIVGHVDSYQNISVFWRLRYVQPGALIYIKRTDGTTVTFKVTDLKQFDQSAFPTAEVYGNIKYPGLRLITCGGTFDSQSASYSQNTVVFATIVD